MDKPTLLLTGASGVLGRALIDELVDDFAVIAVRHRTPVADLRVTAIPGDLRQADLGMPRCEFADLLSRVDVVLHSAANTSWRASREEIVATNVSGTEHLLGVAEQAGAPFYFMSTAFVARAGHAHATDERFGGPGAYLESKVAAEQAVRDSGLPGAILRPSVVIGDSRSGHMSAFQGFSKAAAAVVQGTTPVIPAEPDSLVDAVPQDLVAGATGALIRARACGEYWLTAGDDALPLSELVQTCLDFAATLGLSPHRPRLVPIEAVDRLLLPLLADAIPPKLRRSFREYAELMLLFQSPSAMPSSLAELGFAQQCTREALRAAFLRTLEYWAITQGLFDPSAELDEMVTAAELVA